MAAYKVGDLVAHRTKPEWGSGKVVARDGGDILVYFKNDVAPVPEDRVRTFPASAPGLYLLPVQTDPVLDNIPPYRDKKFVRPKSSRTIKDARQRFLQICPRGFADPRYFAQEQGYKTQAHQRYKEQLAPHVAQWLKEGDAGKARQALLEVYSPSDKDQYPLNLLSPQYEWPAFKDSLAADEPFLKYLDAAVAFAAQPAPDEPTFDRYAEAVAGLPTRPGGTRLEKWTVLTWLPFIANPAHHMFLKPQLTQEFASALPFELQYRPQLNFTTYRRLQEMSSLLKDSISDPELNPAQRELDMIDVQSFMWMVTQYGK